jgi:hypothetical protein
MLGCWQINAMLFGGLRTHWKVFQMRAPRANSPTRNPPIL